MVHTIYWANDIHASNKGFIHNSKGLLLANSDTASMHRVKQNGDKMRFLRWQYQYGGENNQNKAK